VRLARISGIDLRKHTNRKHHKDLTGQNAICADGAGQPGAGPGGHQLPPHLVGVPCLSRPHHTPYQTMRERAPSMHRLLPAPPPLPHLQVRDVRGAEPRHGAGIKTAEVSLPVPPHGVQGGVHTRTEGGTREELSLPAAQMSFSRAVLIRRVALRSCSSPKIRPLGHPRPCTAIWDSFLPS